MHFKYKIYRTNLNKIKHLFNKGNYFSLFSLFCEFKKCVYFTFLVCKFSILSWIFAKFSVFRVKHIKYKNLTFNLISDIRKSRRDRIGIEEMIWEILTTNCSAKITIGLTNCFFNFRMVSEIREFYKLNVWKIKDLGRLENLQ